MLVMVVQLVNLLKTMGLRSEMVNFIVCEVNVKIYTYLLREI